MSKLLAAALVMATYILLSMLFRSGQAQFLIPDLNTPPGPGGRGGGRGRGRGRDSSGDDDDVLKCWSSVGTTEGCVMSIYSSIFNLNFSNIAPSCCQAYLAIDSDCPTTMFPLNPFFPHLINSFCTRLGGAGVPSVTT